MKDTKSQLTLFSFESRYSMLTDEQYLLRNDHRKEPSDDEIQIDNESDIIDPTFADELDHDFRRETGINAPRHFMFPESPPHSHSSLCRGVRDIFRPILPQITSRSLALNAKCQNIQHEAFMVDHRRDCAESDSFNLDEGSTLNLWSAGFVVVNLYLGYGLLAVPWAVAEGGVLSLVPLALICAVMSWSGKLLVRCFNRMRPSKRTYSDIGYKSFGRIGASLTALAVGFGFAATLCVDTILLWRNSQYLVDSFSSDPVSTSWTSFICTVLALPTLWILNLSEMSFVPFIGAVCKSFAIFVVAVCCVLNMDSVADHVQRGDIRIYPKDAQSLSVSMGIFLFSFSGHSALPAVYAAMREPDRFEALLDRCFVALFVIHSVFALSGSMPFGKDTDVVITHNLLWRHLDGDDVDGGGKKGAQIFLVEILLMFLCCGLYFELSPICSSLAEFPEVIVFGITSPFLQRMLRTMMFLFCVAVSYLILNHLPVLMAMTGSLCSITAGIVCPALFCWAVFRNHSTYFKRATLLCAASVAALSGCFLLFNSIHLFPH